MAQDVAVATVATGEQPASRACVSRTIVVIMEGSEFEEIAFFRSVENSGVRAILIGRRALVVLGLPVLTADYDFWIHIDDIDSLNGVAEPFGLVPSHTAVEARQRGRYVLQNDETMDVVVARSVTIAGGGRVVFEELWQRRRSILLGDGVSVTIPSLEDLIATKRIRPRPKDLEDIRLLEALRSRGEP
jgi:hypothetical protein